MEDYVWLFIVGGINLLIGVFGLFNFSRRGRRMVNSIGNTWSRVIYLVLGAICIGIGFFVQGL